MIWINAELIVFGGREIAKETEMFRPDRWARHPPQRHSLPDVSPENFLFHDA